MSHTAQTYVHFVLYLFSHKSIHVTVVELLIYFSKGKLNNHMRSTNKLNLRHTLNIRRKRSISKDDTLEKMTRTVLKKGLSFKQAFKIRMTHEKGEKPKALITT